MSYDVLDLCSGAAGGWSLGLHRAGMKTVAACEAVDWRREMFAANFPGVELYDDLRTLTGARVRSDIGRYPDIVVGSPPCKEYSSVGRGGGLDADDLFLHAVRIVDEIGPRWCAFENSHFVKNRGYDRIAGELEAIGYTCWPLVVEARAFGARHLRPRVVIVGADLSGAQGRVARQPRRHVDVGVDPGRLAGLDLGRDSRTLGPVGSAGLGSHLRKYDGVPHWLAERCREAYGDAVIPQLTEAVGLAMMQADAALADLAS